MEIGNAKTELYCWVQFFSVVNIITRHKTTKLFIDIAKKIGASHFTEPTQSSKGEIDGKKAKSTVLTELTHFTCPNFTKLF